MLIGFPPIFVVDTKIIYGYNFVSPLKLFEAELQNYNSQQSMDNNKSPSNDGLFLKNYY